MANDQPQPQSPDPLYPVPPPPPAPGYVQYAVPVAHSPYPVQAVVVAKNNGLAVASLVLGILWLYWLGSVLAVIFGHVALNQISRSGEMQQGRGLAIAGLVLGWVGVGILLLVLLLAAVGSSGGY